jgi:outer membrane protein TolC
MAGVNVSKTDLEIAKTDQVKATLQVKQTAEKLYFGLLIQQKRKEEALIRLELAQKKLYDVESAVLAGKTTPSSLTGLKANAADEEQNLLRINVQTEDYFDDLRRLTGLKSVSFALAPVPLDDADLSVAPAGVSGPQENQDLKIAALYQTKAQHAVDAGRYSYLPDFGILGGYVYQDGAAGFSGDIRYSSLSASLGLDPQWHKRDAFIGVVLNWNLKDLVANTYITRQRLFLKKQAQENLANTREQIHADTAKARRKLTQTAELIGVAGKVVEYRREDLKIQTDRFSAGLNLEADWLAALAALAKADADLLAARLSYRMAWTDLQILTGRY